MSGTDRTIFGDESGADGRALTDKDFNDISRNGSRRAWEVPGFADLMAFDLLEMEVASKSYGAMFMGDLSVLGYSARKTGCFVRGGGLVPSKTLHTSNIAAGMLGVWNESGTLAPPLSNGDPQLLWAWTDALGTPFTHNTPASGYKRWDLITVRIEELDVAPGVSRDFQDATTGAYSSQTVTTAKRASVIFTLTEGTPTTGTPVVPGTPSGEHAVYAILVDGSYGGILQQPLDLTIPAGPLKVGTTLPQIHGIYAGADWASNPLVQTGNIASVHSGSSDELFVPAPPGLSGNPFAKLLGAAVVHQFEVGGGAPTNGYCSLVRLDVGVASSSFSQLYDLSTEMLVDGTRKRVFFDFRWAENTQPAPAPWWGNGTQTKGGIPTSARALGLYFRSSATGGDGSAVCGVTWYWVEG